MTDPLQDPGVQGLAQLGRNAIDRVAQLEAELAGYVEANRYMKNELEDALEDARKYAEAQREIARLIDANRKYAKALTEHQGSIDWREWMLVPATDASFVTKEKHNAEITRLRHEVATLCGYDSADEMDAATGRRK